MGHHRTLHTALLIAGFGLVLVIYTRFPGLGREEFLSRRAKPHHNWEQMPLRT